MNRKYFMFGLMNGADNPEIPGTNPPGIFYAQIFIVKDYYG